jgi:hypothetical protein
VVAGAEAPSAGACGASKGCVTSGAAAPAGPAGAPAAAGAVHRQQDVLFRLGVLLQGADGVVAVHHQLVHRVVVADDHRPQEQHQVGLGAGAAVVAEQLAHQRDAAQQRHLVVAVAVLVLEQAAQHHGLAVVHHHGGLDRALVGDGTAVRAQGGVLLVDRHADGAALADLALDAQHDAHVLALDRLERVDRVAAAAGVGVAAGDEGHVGADDDLGFLVVQRHQVGRGQHVGAGLGLQEVGQRAQREGAVDLVQDADVDALVQRSGGAGVLLLELVLVPANCARVRLAMLPVLP